MVDDNRDGAQHIGQIDDEPRPDRLADRLAMVGGPASRGNLPRPAMAVAAEHAFRRHFVSQSGHMLLGSRVAAPNLSAAERDEALRRHVLFSSARDAQKRSLSRSAVVLLLCAIAAGATGGVTAIMDGNHASTGTRAQGEPADTARVETASPRPAMPETGSPEFTASISTVVAHSPEAASAAGLTQVAYNTGGELKVQDVSGEVGEAVLLEITVNYDNSGEYAFLMFRGLPGKFSLSAGFKLKDSWAVSLKDLDGLELLPAPGYKGEFDLDVHLVKGRNTVESAVITASFGVPHAAAAAVARAAPEPAPAVAPTPAPQILTSAPPSSQEGLAREVRAIGAAPVTKQPRHILIQPEEESAMLSRALNLLGQGDVASARLLLEHIARKGSGKGALALAQTYDPVYFHSINAVGGLQPDRVKAREWYGIAVQLGEVGARERLSIMSGQ